MLFSGPVGFVRGFLSAGLTFRALATLSLLYGYSTEAAALPVHHPGAELRIDLGRRGEMRLFAGRLLGGRVCISGTCRDVPTFEGARLATILRF